MSHFYQKVWRIGSGKPRLIRARLSLRPARRFPPRVDRLKRQRAREKKQCRLFLKRGGVDEDFVNLAGPHKLEYILKDLEPGSEIQIYVVPANSHGSGPVSPMAAKIKGA